MTTSDANGNRLDRFAVSIGMDIEAPTPEAALLLALEALEKASAVTGAQSRVTDAMLLWVEAVPEGQPGQFDMPDAEADDGGELN